jgi:hypothetical protein
LARCGVREDARFAGFEDLRAGLFALAAAVVRLEVFGLFAFADLFVTVFAIWKPFVLR